MHTEYIILGYCNALNMPKYLNEIDLHMDGVSGVLGTLAILPIWFSHCVQAVAVCNVFVLCGFGAT